MTSANCHDEILTLPMHRDLTTKINRDSDEFLTSLRRRSRSSTALRASSARARHGSEPDRTCFERRRGSRSKPEKSRSVFCMQAAAATPPPIHPRSSSLKLHHSTQLRISANCKRSLRAGETAARRRIFCGASNGRAAVTARTQLPDWVDPDLSSECVLSVLHPFWNLRETLRRPTLENLA